MLQIFVVKLEVLGCGLSHTLLSMYMHECLIQKFALSYKPVLDIYNLPAHIITTIRKMLKLSFHVFMTLQDETFRRI